MFVRLIVALALAGQVSSAASSAAPQPGHASAAVTIGFAPADGYALGRGVTIAFQNATTLDGTGSPSAGVSIGFRAPLPAPAQLGNAKTSAFNADPVNTATGNHIFEHTDLSVQGRGVELAFARFYNSLDETSGPLGPGWTHSYNVSLTVGGDQSVQVRWADGHVDYYDLSGGVYLSRYAGGLDTLTRASDGVFTVAKKSQQRWRFTSGGRLSAITDRNGNAVSLSYDSNGRLAAVAEPGGRSLTFSIDGAGRITTVADALPRTVTYAYTNTGYLQSVTDVDGGVESYTYDTNGQMLTATDPRGAVFMTNTYDNDRRVVTWQADAKGNRFEFDYDEASGETRITDPLGRTSIDSHDVLKRLIKQTDRLGRNVSYTYDDQNNRTSVTDQNGHATTYTYDAFSNVTGSRNPLGHTTSVTYNATHDLLTRTDQAGGITRLTYDARGNLLTSTNPLGHVTTLTYNAFGQVLTVTDAGSGVVTSTYDTRGDLISWTDAVAAATTFSWDDAGRRTTVTDARGHATVFTYDGSDRVLTSTDAEGGLVSNVFDANGNLTRATDARGATTTLTYDVNNLLTSVTDASGAVIRHTYDGLNRRLTTVDGGNHTTTFMYDAESRLTKTTDGTGRTTTVSYDGARNKTSVTNGNGHATLFAYDALNRLVSTTDATGGVTRQSYDPLGNITSLTDPLSRVTTMTWDAGSRLREVVDPAGGTVRYTYDAVGNRLTSTDPNGQTTTFTYDAASRVRSSVDPLGRITTTTHDANGNRATLVDANGAMLTYGYDQLNRLISIQPPSGAATTFGYDANGNQTSMVDGVGTTSSIYDVMNRLTRRTDVHGQAVGYEYDAVGNRTALIYPDGKRVAYAFDAARRMTLVTDWAGRATRYTYDLAGQLLSTAHANGTVVSTTYDAAGRLTTLANRRSDASVVSSYAFILDAAGNRTGADLREPLQATGLATSVAYGYNAGNQIQTLGDTSFTSDMNGNVTGRTSAAGSVAYAWDVFDRLTQVTGGTAATQYVYSGSGLRVGRVVAGATTRYVVDTQPELSQMLAETDATGAVSVRYVYGLGLISRVDAPGSALTYHFDPRGSTVAMTDTAGTVVNSYAYDEFGAVRQRTEAVAQPFQYVGQWGVTHEPNDLLFMRARYYSPAEGRFLSVDPAPTLLTSQDLNLFIYAVNNPVGLTDPSGLSPHRSETRWSRGAETAGSSSGNRFLQGLKRIGGWAADLVGIKEVIDDANYGSQALGAAGQAVELYELHRETEAMVSSGELAPEFATERTIVGGLFKFLFNFGLGGKADKITGGSIEDNNSKILDRVFNLQRNHCLGPYDTPTCVLGGG